MEKALFWKYPWRKDVSGSESLVRSATVETLHAIHDTWYVPNNAALFVGGDIDPAQVRAAVQKAFGDWPRARDPWVPPPPPQEAPPKDLLLVYRDEQMYAGVAAVGLSFRGPDVTRDPASTYAADVWGSLLDDPNGRFKSRIFEEVPGLYRKEYVNASYRTMRDGGYISFSTLLVTDPKKDTFGRLLSLKKAFLGEMKSIASTPDYFSKRDFDVLVRRDRRTRGSGKGTRSAPARS